MQRILSAVLFALAPVLLLAAGCSEGPLGPDAADGGAGPPPSIAGGPGAGGPMFLIGDSPLITLLQDPNTGQHVLNVEVEVTRGLTQAANNDRFFLRSAAEFTKGGTLVASIGAKDTGVTGGKDAKVRGGGMVALQPCVDIPTDDGTCDGNVCQKSTWQKLVDANQDGSGVDATVTVQLILIDAAGKEHVLDEARNTAQIDPKGNANG